MANSGRTSGVVGRPHDTLVGGEEAVDLLLPPDMVAGGDHVHAGAEKLEGKLGRDAGAVGGVLAPGDHEADGPLLAEAGQPAQQRFAARLAEHVADEEEMLNATLPHRS